MKDTHIIAACALAFLLGFALGNVGQPRLVGYGCEGAGGIVYANEESDFPFCERIEVR